MGVLTANIAVLKVDQQDLITDANNSQAVGILRDIRYTENYRRGAIRGIGRMNPSEVPALDFSATLTASFMNIRFDSHPFLQKALLRRVGANNTEGFLNTLALQRIGFTLELMKKVVDGSTGNNDEGRDGNGIINIAGENMETFATIKQCFITSDGFDLTENQISGRNCNFDVTEGVTYAVDADIPLK